MVQIYHEDTSSYTALDMWNEQTGEWQLVSHYDNNKCAMEDVIKHSGRYRRQAITETIIIVTE